MSEHAFPASGARIFCIGRNYAEHAREMRAETPPEPVIFMKPSSSCLGPGAVPFPAGHGQVDFEGELVFELSGDLSAPIRAAGLGVDLTLRDRQAELKAKGLPWETAKAFEGSALLGPRVALQSATLGDLSFRLLLNDQLRQQGQASEMIFSPEELVRALSVFWTPRAGDLLFSGTPSGVGPLQPGDEIFMDSPQLGSAVWQLQQ